MIRGTLQVMRSLFLLKGSIHNYETFSFCDTDIIGVNRLPTSGKTSS